MMTTMALLIASVADGMQTRGRSYGNCRQEEAVEAERGNDNDGEARIGA
jgi:hypothetical protein